MNNHKEKFHLVILGGGSAAFAASLRASELGARATIINSGLPTGGTCVNVGCVPSKNLIRAAEVLHRANKNPFSGIEARADVRSFAEVIQGKRDLVSGLRQAKYIDVIKDNPDIRLITGRGKLVDRNQVEVNGEKISADAVLIATGATASIPEVPGLAESGYLTNESLFELEALPESIIVLGGRFVALECAQMLARFGVKVTVLQRSPRILPTEGADLTEALSGYLMDDGIEFVTGVSLKRVEKNGNQNVILAEVGGAERKFSAAALLVATGRKANTAAIGLNEQGVELRDNGFLKVDDYLRTNVQGIYGVGDVLGENMFVYTAAYEGKLAVENMLGDNPVKRDYTALPWVVFTDPQVAGIGLDEKGAREAGLNADVAVLPLSHVPRAIAARDTRGFIKLIRDTKTDTLVGARILAPEGSELLMEVALAIKFKIPVAQMKEMFHAYLTLSEGIKLAAITFDKKVSELSCCAS